MTSNWTYPLFSPSQSLKNSRRSRIDSESNMKNRIAAFASLPFASIDRMSLGTRLRDIGRLDGATVEQGKAS